jgi:hypothetical protein
MVTVVGLGNVFEASIDLGPLHVSASLLLRNRSHLRNLLLRDLLLNWLHLGNLLLRDLLLYWLHLGNLLMLGLLSSSVHIGKEDIVAMVAAPDMLTVVSRYGHHRELALHLVPGALLASSSVVDLMVFVHTPNVLSVFTTN